MCLHGQRICGGHNYKKGRRIGLGCWNERTLVEAEGLTATEAARKSSKSVPESSLLFRRWLRSNRNEDQQRYLLKR